MDIQDKLKIAFLTSNNSTFEEFLWNLKKANLKVIEDTTHHDIKQVWISPKN